jgi:hypothetical protein
MKRLLGGTGKGRILLVLTLFLFIGMLCGGSSWAQDPWTQVGNLSQARAGHTGTLLADGRILIVGGENPNPAALVKISEIFDPATGQFSAGAELNIARADHSATLLPDGKVFIIGGRNSGGTLTSTEIYDPAAGSFAVGPSLNRARTAHSAIVLQNGNILIAGGDAEGTAEVYLPETQMFALVQGQLAVPRAYHGAALMPSGKVLIAGGAGLQNNPLNSAEIFDTQTMTFSPASTPMGAARWLPLLRVLPDGKVQVIGGDAGSSMEMFDPAGGGFNALSNLPPSLDMVTPPPSIPNLLSPTLRTQSRAALITKDISTVESMQGFLSDPLLGLLDRSDYSLTEIPQLGKVLVAGGFNGANDFLPSTYLVSASSAAVTTDKTDYAPGEVVTITGTGFTPGEEVWIIVHEMPYGYEDSILYATADANGNFTNTQFSPQPIDIGRTFTLTAIGQASGSTAQTAFTDTAPSVSISSPTNSVPVTLTSLPGNVTVSFSWANWTTSGTTVTASICTNMSCTTVIASSTPKAESGASGSDSVVVTVPTGTANGLYAVGLDATDGSTVKKNTQNNAVNVTTTIQNTITTSPPGLQVIIDGGAAQTAPVTVNWTSGSSHTIATTSPQAGAAGTQSVWTSWSDAGNMSHNLTAPSTSTTYTANFKTQYQLTFSQSGIAGDSTGTVVTVDGKNKPYAQLPDSSWFDSGASVSYTYADPVSSSVSGKRYALTTPAPSPSSPITVTEPRTITGTYKTQFQLTFAQSGLGGDATGTIVTVNGGAKSTLPFSDWFDSGASVPYTYADAVSSSVSGKRYALTTPAPSPTSPITVLAVATITGTYKTQFQLTFAQSGIGGDSTGTVVTVNASAKTAADLPFSDWFDSGAPVTYLYADPVASTVSGKRYALTTPAPSPTSPITVLAVATITGTYKTQYQITFAQSGIGGDSTGTVVAVNGSPKTAADLPFSAWYDSNASVAYAYSDPVASSVLGKRYALTTPAPSPTTPIAVLGPITVTGTYKVQAQLTFGQSGIGGDSTSTVVTVNGNGKTAAQLPFSDWFDSSATVIYSYTDPVASTVTGKRYALTTPAPYPASPIAVSGPITVTGIYKVQYQLTFGQSGIGGDSTGTVVTVNGNGKTAVQLPFNDWFDSNATVTYSYTDPVASTVTGKRYALTTPAPSPTSPITVSGAATITGTYKTQYQLTITTNPSSAVARTNVTPPDGWYDSTVQINLSATSPLGSGSGIGYVFKNWTGDVTSPPNTTNPLNNIPMNQARTIFANYTTWTLQWAADVTFSAQYSDPSGLKAVLTADGSAQSGKTINFSVGANSGSASTDANGVATDPTLLTQAPGTYTATASCLAAQCGVALSITHNYQITKEDARVTYTGTTFAWTTSPTSSTANVVLSATIRDITAVSGDASYDAYAGDIRNATVRFISGATTLCTASVGLVNPSDTKTGTAACNASMSVGSTGSTSYTVGIIIDGYYLRNSSEDDSVLTVSKPQDNFITGGGFLLVSSSVGSIAGNPGSKNNFGFNVKYNKNGTNLQGSVNIIVRSNGHVYQIKSTAINSLYVDPATGKLAQFNAKANIQDITNPLQPISIAGSGDTILQLKMTDNGEPGSADSIGITVSSTSGGGIWFSSNWDGTKTIEQLLGGGNLVVH